MRVITANPPIIKKSTVLIFLVVFISSLASSLVIQTPRQADALSGSQFNPGRIIDDSVFYNKNAMTAAQIQSFLNSKMPDCDTDGSKSYSYYYRASPIRLNDPRDTWVTTTRAVYGQRVYQRDGGSWRGSRAPYTCLNTYRQTTTDIAPESGLCNGYTGASNESAAQIIYKASQSCGVNPQVMLVVLQKEQSLLTDDWPWSLQYNKATGVDCPDNPPAEWAPYDCKPSSLGFFKQVYYSAHRFKWYKLNADSYQYKAGRNNTILWHPNSGCGTSNVYIQNQATAALYIYTPYRPNQAALNNLYGEGDSCSSYGNRNFWRMFNDWFGPTTGTTLFRFGSSDGVYILGSNSNYYHIPSRRILDAYGYGTTVGYVQSVSSSHVSGLTFSGNLPLIARFQGDEIYMMDKGHAHHFTSRQLLQAYGYDIGAEALLPDDSKLYYPTAENMQTTARSADGPEVWHVEDAKKRHIIDGEAYYSGDPMYASRPQVVLSANIMASVNNGAPVLTGNKLLKRSDTNTYVFWDGTKRQNISNRVVSELGIPTAYATRASMIDQLNPGGATIDKLVKDTANNLYVLDTRQKLLVSPADLEQLNLAASSFNLVPSGLLDRVPTTNPFKRIFRIGSEDAVYLIENGMSHHLFDPAAVSDKDFSVADAIRLNPTSASLFPNSGKKILARGTLFRINSSDKVYIVNSQTSSLHIPSSAMLRDFGLSIRDVYAFTPSRASGYPETGKLGYFTKDISANVWLMQRGNDKLPVTSQMQGSTYYGLNVSTLPVLDQVLIDRFDSIPPLTNLVQVPGDSKIYKIENGKKRWIPNRAIFDANGLSFDSVTNVSASFLGNLRSGSNLQ